jgi:hypothetical protein
MLIIFYTSVTLFTYHSKSNDVWERVGLVGLDVGWGPNWFGMHAPLVEALGPSPLMESSPFISIACHVHLFWPLFLF